MFDDIRFDIYFKGKGGYVDRLLQRMEQGTRERRWVHCPINEQTGEFELFTKEEQSYSDIGAIAADIELFTEYVNGASISEAYVDFKFNSLEPEDAIRILKRAYGMQHYHLAIMGAKLDEYALLTRELLNQLQYERKFVDKNTFCDEWNKYISGKTLIDATPYVNGDYNGFKVHLGNGTTDFEHMLRYYCLFLSHVYNGKNAHRRVKADCRNHKDNFRSAIHTMGANGTEFKSMRRALYRRIRENYQFMTAHLSEILS